MVRKILKVLLFGVIGVVSIAVVAIGGMILWFRNEQSKYASTAVPYLQHTIPTLAQWNPATAKKFMAPEAHATTSDQELEKLLGWLKKLGEFRSMEEPSLVNIFSGSIAQRGKVKVLTYTIKASFSSGPADLTLRLVEHGPSFQIYAVHVSSKALIG